MKTIAAHENPHLTSPSGRGTRAEPNYNYPMIILIHSSKTMRHSGSGTRLRQPVLIDKARRLHTYLLTLSPEQLGRVMSISPALAEKTHALIAEWTAEPERQSLAIDSFTGDIYSGLHANDLPPDDREYADKVLRILSGLYGILRPYDGISPYRLEMGYKLPDPTFASLYAYWGDSIAATLPADGVVVNLAAEEYSQVVTRYIDPARVAAPRFLTVSPKTGQPVFVVVHAKIARGAFARWLITQRIEVVSDLSGFDDLGYHFAAELSSPESPTFVCETFGGKGLSIRLG
jgi:uncharacterized protein